MILLTIVHHLQKLIGVCNMSWVLYLWIGYAGYHSTMTFHAEFKTEQKCQEAGQLFLKQQQQSNARHSFYCIPKEKNG